MVLVVELATKDGASSALASRITEEYLETLLGSGLLKFRIARSVSEATRLILIEEWTTAAAHSAIMETPAFKDVQAHLAPLLAAPAHRTQCEIVAAGVASA